MIVVALTCGILVRCTMVSGNGPTLEDELPWLLVDVTTSRYRARKFVGIGNFVLVSDKSVF